MGKQTAMKNRPFHERLAFSIKGLHAAWRRESSFRTQIGIAGAALLFLIIVRPPVVWWAIVLLTVALVLAMELMNSAIEALIDHLHPERHSEIGIIKDIAAGGVLVVSIGAVAVGLCLLFSLLA